jgi:hypothetical protein
MMKMVGHPNQKQKIGKRGHGHPSNNEFRRRRKSRQQKKHFIMDDGGNIWGNEKRGRGNDAIEQGNFIGERFGAFLVTVWLNLWYEIHSHSLSFKNQIYSTTN